ncbi:MAG: hypothetical protein LUI01_08005 [Firmicutes bacterium]|nr:hypothetical protein [Bacillota bacterium]
MADIMHIMTVKRRYYATASGVKRLYVQVTYNNIKYTGFCCGTYLKKQ